MTKRPAPPHVRPPDRPDSVRLAAAVARTVRRRLRPWAEDEDAWPGMLGFCGAASVAVATELERRGVPCIVVLEQRFGDGFASHLWVVVGGMVVDATATQFWPAPPVLVTREEGCYARRPEQLEDVEAMIVAWSWPLTREVLDDGGGVRAKKRRGRAG